MDFREAIEKTRKNGMEYWAGNANAFITYRWRTEPPTEPGWYWVMSQFPPPDNGEIGKPAIVFFDGEISPFAGYEYRNSMELFTHWLGPLPVPEPPK